MRLELNLRQMEEMEGDEEVAVEKPSVLRVKSCEIKVAMFDRCVKLSSCEIKMARFDLSNYQRGCTPNHPRHRSSRIKSSIGDPP